MRPTAFLFSSGRRARLENSGPTEFLYGFAELSRAGQPVAMYEECDLGTEKTWPRLFEALSARASSLTGVSPRLAVRLLKALSGPLADYQTLIATTQSIGMALAALKAFGCHDKRIVMMTMGLVETGSHTWRKASYRRLLRGCTLAVLSKLEARSLRSWIGDRTEVADFTFGVDLDFWSPSIDTACSGEILSIGNDRARDYQTLMSAWRPDFPRLTIITSLPVSSSKPNVSIERGDWRGVTISDVDLRERVRRARFVITPVRDTIQPSGQSSTLQAMACGRPVIMSSNKGLWDLDLMNAEHCRLVPPENADALSRAITEMIADPAAAEALGMAARKAIVSHDISARSMAKQIEGLAS